MAEKKQRREKGDGSISQRKDGTWTSRIRVGTTLDGKPQIKAFYGKTEREVKKKLKDFQKELHKNDGVVVQKNTVETYMTDWLTSVKRNELKPKSYDRLETTLKYQVFPYIGNLQVAALQPDDVQKMINALRDKGLSYSSIKKAYDAVNDCFRSGVIKRTITYNPALGVSVPAKKSFGKKQIRCYTKEESDKLIAASVKCWGNGKPIYRLGNMVKLVLNTGIRLAEILGLRWEDISFDNRILTVAQTVVIAKDRTGKAGTKYVSIVQDSAKTESSERSIYLNDEALDALKQLYTVTGKQKYVFSTDTGNKLNPRYPDTMFRKIAVMAGFPEDKIYGLHALRHTFASRLFENGEDVKTVSEILGHSDITITYNTYIHLINDQKKKALADLNKKKEEQAEPKAGEQQTQ